MMLNKFKNFFKKILENKKFLILFSFLILLGLFLPITEVKAEGADPLRKLIDLVIGLVSTPIKIALFIVGLFCAFLSLLAIFFFGISAAIATWVISDVLMKIPITGKESWAQEIGWALTRDFANMFFILIMVIIGIATILKIEEYKFEKTLPKLIAIALLVNFSPLIVGLVVDFSNIITKFFLEEVRGEGGLFARSLKMSWDILKEVGKLIVGLFRIWGSPFEMMGRVAIIQVMGIFSAVGAFVYLLLSAVFFFRVIAFWILLILAPIAFLAYILPATRSWWTMWWNHLIQWGLVGIIASFFLYLSNHFTAILAKEGNIYVAALEKEILKTAEGWAGIITAEMILAITKLLPYAMGLAFLLVGIMIALTAAGPAGAFIRAGATVAVTRAGAAAWGVTKRGFQATYRGFERGWKEYRAARYPAEGGPLSRGEALRLAITRGARTMAREAWPTWAETREAARHTGRGVKAVFGEALRRPH